MSSLPHNDQSTIGENDATFTDNSSLFPLEWNDLFCLPPDSPSEPTSILDQNDAPIQSATRDAPHQPSESSETIMLGNFYDGGTSDYSFTLEDLPSYHDVGDNKSTQKFPFMVVPGFLEGHTDVPSYPPPSDCKEEESRQMLYSDMPALQNGTEKSSANDDFFLRSRAIRIPSLGFDSETTPGEHPSIEDWVSGNRPILQDYADRQISLPVGERLEVSVKEPSQSILAALKLLANRDQEGYVEPSRRLGPQLIENFAEIDCWAKEYLRARHHTRIVDSEVTSLLTIVINNFYEAQVQLVDGLVTRALENMRTGGRSNLSLEDFAIGFVFQSSENCAQASSHTCAADSRLPEARPIRALEVECVSEPVAMSSGHQVNPTQCAQQASGTNGSGRRNKGKEIPRVKDQQTLNGSVTTMRQKKSTTKPISNHTVTATPEDVAKPPPPNTTPIHLKYRPIVPSNLCQSSILPFSPPTIATAPAWSDDNPESVPCGPASADGLSNTSPSRSNAILQSSPRSTIRLPVPNTIVNAATDSRPTLTKSDEMTANASETAPRGRGGSGARRSRPRGPRNGGRGRGSKNTTVTPNAELLLAEATSGPDSTHTLPTDIGAATHSPTFDATEVLRNFFLSLTGTIGTTASARTRTEDGNNTDTRDENMYTSHSTRTGRLFALPGDSRHPQGKKRKLDDCDD
ncbi:hypothetical protein JVU11DRAFT_9578 [Chiua virens]|nr:hypothetical protein JVU11DRAFT_9578 [Chiua virens]